MTIAEPAHRPRTRKQHLRNLLLIVIGGCLVFNARSFWWGKERAFEGYTDYCQFYAGATAIREGLGERLYTYEAQQEIQQKLFGTTESRTGPLFFYHAPYEILLFVPLTYGSYRTAYLAWLIVNAIMLVGVLVLLFPFLRNIRPTFSVNIALSLFAFFPVFIGLYQGQDSFLLLLLLTLAFVSVKKDRPLTAGIFLGLGLFRFHLVLPFMLLFVVKKQWRVIHGFLITAVLVSIGSLAVTGWVGLVRYVQFLWEINQNLSDPTHQTRYALFPTAMANFRGVLYRLLAGEVPDIFLTLASLSFSLLILLWFVAFVRKGSQAKTDMNLEFSLAVVVMILVGFHVHMYDLSFLILPILLVSNHFGALSERPRGRPLWTLRVTALILLMTPVYVLLIGLQFVGLLTIPILIFAALIATEATAHRPAPTQAAAATTVA
jgi:Glycosyltransferase family 87